MSEPVRDERSESVAVVGMAGRFPGAGDLDAYWRNLRDGVESITAFSPEELAAAGVAPELLADPRYVRAGAVLQEVDLFDAGLFGFAPREAELTDPQHRIFLEQAWEALENAGYDPARYPGSIGIFGGMGMSKYLLYHLLSRPEVAAAAGPLQLRLLNDKDFLVSTVAFKLGLTGPSVTVQTACSTSLVAVCFACQSLLNYQCDMALAGGITVALPQKTGYLAQDNFLSPDGHCRTFDAAAQGTVEGSGAGLVVLKRLSDALADGDTIHAVITGYATNNDGSLKVGYTAPNPEAQAEVVAMAQAMAGIAPETVSYVEAHGTGTPLGDPIEVSALTRAFAGAERHGFCALGSVKTNIGHLDAAAGIAGLIKTVLALDHEELPPSLHFRTPNPQIDFAGSPFFVNAVLRPWRRDAAAPRRAGVSSFSMGGVNAHVVVEEAPVPPPPPPARPWDLLVLSARSEAALDTLTERLAGHLERRADLELADVAHTLQQGRRALAWRRVVAARDHADAVAALRDPQRRLTAVAPEPAERPVVFLLSGQGSQYPGMGRDLYREEPVFRREIDRCAAFLGPGLGTSLRQAVDPPEETVALGERLARTDLAQPVLFAVEYALARLWMEQGIAPAALMGHSLGEYVAACLAGVMTLEEGLALVVERGRLMQELPGGAMLAVALPEAEIGGWLDGGLSVAAVNEPSRCVVSGPEAAVDDLARRLAERGVESRRLAASHAFHSAMMDPVLDRFRAAVARVSLRPPRLPFVSNRSGTWIRDEEATGPYYWAAHLREPVRFADGLATLFREGGEPILLEVGPGNALSALARRQVPGCRAFSSLRHPKEEVSDVAFFLTTLGRFWLAGSELAFPSRHPGQRRRIPLPAYPFERQRYWIEARPLWAGAAAAAAATAGEPAPRHERPALATDYAAPRNPVEERLAALWQEVLGLSRVGVHDDLFELGGHSLLGTQLLARIRGAFGVELPSDAFFTAPTVARLAEVVAREQAGGKADGAPATLPRRVPGAGPARLSFAQERLWFIAQLDPTSPAYNLPATLRLRGELDAAALARSLAELVRRHEALRTTFALVDGRPVQRVGAAGPVSLPYVDLATVPADLRRTEARALSLRDAATPLDLQAGPLLRATLVRLAPAEHLALLNIHHLVSDAWSAGLLVRDTAEIYAALREGRPCRLPELPVQYADFAEWQRERLEGALLAELLGFWKQHLAGELPVLELPVDGPRPAAGGDRGGSCTLTLPASLAQALAELGRQEGATLFMLLLTLLQVLLGRYSGQEDVIVGAPVAGRDREETEGLVGLFLNTLPLRGDLRGDPSFRELLGRVRTAALEAFAHRELPFEKLVEELRPERGLGRHPLFDVTLNVLNTPRAAARVPGLEIEMEPLLDGSAQLALTLYVTEAADGGLDLRLVYKRDLFTPRRVAAILDQLAGLAEQAVADPERPVGSFSLVTAAARALLPDPALPLEQDFHEPVALQVAERARRAPADPAVRQGERTWSYAEMAAAVRDLAELLALRTGGPRQVVAVGGGAPSFGLVASLLGVLASGSVLLTLDPALPPARRRLMARRAGARFLLHVDGAPPDAELRQLLPWLEILHVDPESGRPLEEGGGRREPPVVGPDDPAYIFFTSGSTGVPKGVLGSHKGVSHFVDWQRDRFAVGPGDRCAQLIGLSFDALLRDVFLPLTSGATLCLPAADGVASPPRLVDWLRREGITLLHTLPAVAQSWIASLDGPRPLPALRRVFFSGEPLTGVLVERWRRAFPGEALLVNLYGPTETTMVKCCYVVPEDPASGVQPLGHPLPATQALVLNGAGALCGVSEPGEIAIRTPFRTLGYINAPEENRARFVPNPARQDPHDRIYRTGDRGRYRPDGFLELLGRLDEQVKIRGVRVEPSEVEAALATHPAVREVAVAAHDDRGERRLVAYLVLEPGAQVADRELRAGLRERLPEAMVPGAFVRLDRLPLTASGKVDRRALPAPEEGAAEDGYARPTDPLEEILAGIWADVLGIGRVGVDDDFFALGGHSLVATQVVSRIQGTLGVTASVRWLFEHPTVRGLAPLVAAARPRGGVPAPALAPVPRGGDLPLSFAQQRLWFLDRLEVGAGYVMPAALHLAGRLDREALARSLAEIVRRHESLRTSFPTVEGEPEQVVEPFAGDPLAMVNLGGLAGIEERRAAAGRVVRALAARPFDLTRGPLHRFLLVRLAPEEHVLALAVHHIVSDAWSIGVLVRELTALYAAFARGEASPLPELPLQYADYAVWQRRWLTGEALGELVDGWRSRLGGMPTSIELPADRPYPPEQTFRGGRVPFRLDRGATAALLTLARGEGASLFMALLAAFQVVLQRYSGQDDLAVGTPVAGRTRRELEGLIGLFVNTLVLRGDLAGDSSFRELLGRGREMALNAFSLQDLPFEKLVEELRPARDLARPPLFQIMLVLQNAPLSRLALGEAALTPLPVDTGTAKLELLLMAAEEEGEIAGHLEYNADLFDRSTAGRLVRHLEGVIAGATADPALPVSRLRLLAAGERHQLLVGWNDTAVAYAWPPERGGLHHLVEAQAARTPAAVAVSCAGESLTYAELDARANGLARHLRSLGCGPETRVGLFLERSLEMLVALLGTLKSGAAYVPIDPDAPRERLAFLLADARPAVLLTQERLQPALPATAGPVLTLHPDGRESRDYSDAPLGESVEDGQLAYVLYTSGSTGRPKGAMVHHAGIRNRLLWMQEAYGLGAADTVLQKTPYSFDVSVWEFFWPLLAGARLAFALPGEHRAAAALAARIAIEGATVLHFVPSMLQAFLEEPGAGGCRSVRRAVASGEALTPELVRRCHERLPGVALENLYGPTECSVDVTFQPCPPGMADGIVPIGRPIANTRIHVLDRGQDLVPVGVAGEIYIGGVGLARGYLGRPDLTAERFVPDPFPEGGPGARLYRSGDRARRRAQGEIEFLGRLDHQVKLRGHRIELGEIEAALAAQPAVRAAAVVLRECRGEPRLVAYVVPAGGELEAVALRQALRERLPEVMIPTVWMALADLPLSSSGKVDRRALPEPEDEPGRRSLVAPRNPLEEELAAIWREVLGHEQVSVQDDFFALGGHSLLATRVVSRVRDRFQVELALPDLFREPTVERLAALVEAGRARPAARPLPRIGRVRRGGGDLEALRARLDALSAADGSDLLPGEGAPGSREGTA